MQTEKILDKTKKKKQSIIKRWTHEGCCSQLSRLPDVETEVRDQRA